MTFKKIEARADFPKIEKEILKKWKKEDTFKKSIEEKQENYTFSFFDGPPFATGLPHHGHLLISTVKDIIARFHTMQGKRVERVWGWDCHGLPIEYEKEKELGLNGKQDIEKMGVDKFNESCRSTILKYADEWQKVIERLGRWVDMDNDYKTMEPWYMESIWWVTKELHKKGLIYEGYKPMHICPRCATPLSNFEVALGYKDIQDLSCTAKFKINGSADKKSQKVYENLSNLPSPVYMLAWTTTPWTLPGNIALAVNEKEDYVLIDKGNEYIILAFELAKKILGENFEEKLAHTYKGSELVGLSYEPLFSVTPEKEGRQYVVVGSDVVTMVDGTGVLHVAPAFGSEDYEIGKKEKLGFIQHITIEGIVKPYVKEFKGKTVKTKDNYTSFDKEICDNLEKRNLLFKKETYNHSYPLCWRCDTPLLNFAFETWFIKIEGKLKEKMIEKNKEIHWVPGFAGNLRFANWIENAPDWAFSRNRYWGTPLPIWKGYDKEGNVKDTIFIGSRDEVLSKNPYYEKTKKKVTKIDDLHKHFVDDIVWEENGLTYRRVPEVFDCWFESGAMPYASNHFPFKDEKGFMKKFPADFISEAMDQTRGWFYTLLVESAAIFQDVPAKNIVVMGLLLAEDGKKLSKSKRNFTDPTILFDTKGVDAFRFTLINSPVVKGENAKFTDTAIDEKLKTILIPLWNSLSFLTTYANIDKWTPKNIRRVYLVRHGTTDLNNEGKLQGSLDLSLNKEGQNQAKKVSERLSKIDIDSIYSSNLKRAYETVTPLANAKKTKVNKIEDLNEIILGDFEGKTLEERAEYRKPILAKNKNMESWEVPYPTGESYVDDFYKRVKKGLDGILEKNEKAVVLSTHKSTTRALEQILLNYGFGKGNHPKHWEGHTANGQIKEFVLLSPKHPLDKWILSELQTLISKISDELYAYDLQKASDEFAPFLDKLNNWYIRRSRRRFWKSENDSDKNEAYETLWYVLDTLNKLLAPFCPFLSEHIYDLLRPNTKVFESVHLDHFPLVNYNLIDKDLEKETNTAREIVSLGLLLRSKNNIKVRQPLPSAHIAIGNKKLFKEMKKLEEVIKEELNVKDIIWEENASNIANVSLSPDARKIGPRFGGKTQEIIILAKQGKFKDLGEGIYEIGGENLHPGEYEFRYEPKGNLEAQGLGEILVGLDTTITDELRKEGILRDLIREIQEARKEANFNISDRITISIDKIDDLDFDKNMLEILKSETLTTEINSYLKKCDFEKEIEIFDIKTKLKLQRNK